MAISPPSSPVVSPPFASANTALPTKMRAKGEPVIVVEDLAVGFHGHMVNDGLSFNVYRGEVVGVIGPSGTGKSVLMRTIVGLLPKQRGKIEVFGQDMSDLSDSERLAIEKRWGILFQQGALFSALTVKQNIQLPMREFLKLSPELLEEMAYLKLELVGLPASAADKLPSELSGGMIKRAALARALALDPEIIFLDEPTSGLDPIGARDFDELIGTLQRTLGITVYMITHDLDSLHSICDRIIALGEGKILAAGTLSVLQESTNPWLRSYFHGPRARRIIALAQS